MQMGFGYADDDTPVPLGHGRVFIILTRGAVASAWTLSLKQGRTQFSLRRQNRGGDANAERVGKKTQRFNLSKQIWEEDEFLNKGDKI